MSKILVTGGSGFIGRALTDRLKAMGIDVASMGSVDGDIASQETLAKFEKENIAHVFHLAGKTFVPDSWDDPQSFCQVNVLGTVNILEFCRKKRIPITYVSAYVYGHPDRLPISENDTVQPSNPYALSKRLAEEVCTFYSCVHNLSVTIIRPFNVYGIGQSEIFLIPEIIKQVLADGENIIVKDLVPKRDYVYLEDLLIALLATLDNLGGSSVYNIGSGISLSVQEVIDIIQGVAGTDKKVICDGEERINELMDVVADISKAKNELGWHPEYSFQLGIEKILQNDKRGLDE